MDIETVYFESEAQETLERIARAVIENPVTVDGLVTAAEKLAVLSRWGLTPDEAVTRVFNSMTEGNKPLILEELNKLKTK